MRAVYQPPDTAGSSESGSVSRTIRSVPPRRGESLPPRTGYTSGRAAQEATSPATSPATSTATRAAPIGLTATGSPRAGGEHARDEAGEGHDVDGLGDVL